MSDWTSSDLGVDWLMNEWEGSIGDSVRMIGRLTCKNLLSKVSQRDLLQ